MHQIPTPPLVGHQGNLRFRAHAPTELGVFVEAPSVTTHKCWSWPAGAFWDCAQCHSCSLFLALVTSISIVPWHLSLCLCCANLAACTISDLAKGCRGHILLVACCSYCNGVREILNHALQVLFCINKQTLVRGSSVVGQ